jgi:hypothetical protein
MNTEYSDRKIKEIMSKVNGQGKLAEQAVMALLQRDPIFLQSLVEPYLDGIILHAIERARKASGLKEPKPSRELPKKVLPSKTSEKPTVSNNTMDNLMKAWAKEFEDNAPQPKPGAKKVSQSHIDVLTSMMKKKNS